jgi:hypothetical protein
VWSTTYLAIQELQAQLLQQGLWIQAVKLPAWHHLSLLQRQRISNSSWSTETVVLQACLKHILQGPMAATAAARQAGAGMPP